MSLSAILGNALSGLQASQTRIGATASNVANQQTPDYRRLQTSLQAQQSGGVAANNEEVGEAGQPDELSDMTNLIEAGQGFAANASVFETGADMWAVLSSIKRD